ncbi:MAG: hypothetical protein ACKVVT_02415 [Dehalococcoidia bacterium]
MSTLTFELTPVSAIDAAEVATLVNLAFARYEILNGDRTDVAGLLEEAGTSGEFLERRDAAGALIATAMIRPAADYYAAAGLPPGISAASAMYFGLAAIHPREMNGGLGGQILAEAEALAARRGFSSIVLSTVREFGLVEYYARKGYIVVAHQDYAAGHWDIAVPHRTCDMVKGL